MTGAGLITPLDAWIAAKIGAPGQRIIEAEVKRYQLARLNSTINRARQLSPFYRRHFAAIEARELARVDDLTVYPFTTPADVTAHAMQLICGSQSEISRVVTLATSGTTGEPKRIYFSTADQELTVDFFRCGMSTLVGPADKTLILLPGERPGSVGELLRLGLLRMQVQPVAYGLVRDVAAAVKTMCSEQATCLVGVPVQVLAMARHWEKWQGSRWAPRCALLSTDHVPAAIVSELRRIWQCEVFDHYGMTEMGLGGGIECRTHQGYHLREADLYFEVVDPVSTQPLPAGEYGEVVFTTLTRQGMPLIRYRTGDISRFIPEPCPCGSSLRRLEKVRSRLDGRINLAGNMTLTMAELDEVLFALPAVADFSAKVVCGNPAELAVTVAILPDETAPTVPAILNTLRQLPAIQAAEQTGCLALRAEIVNHFPGYAGKRKIQITELTGRG